MNQFPTIPPVSCISGGPRRRGGPDRHPGHSGPGGLRRHSGQLFQIRRGVPLCVLYHGT